MKNYINKVQLLGHLGQDPEIKSINENMSLVKMTLATNESFKDKNGEYQTKTQWHNLTAWGKLATNMADKLGKGSFVLINGKLEHNSWEDKAGNKKYGTNVVVQDYLLVQKSVAEAVEA